MTIKEVGFRPLYHDICAFDLNDQLKELIKDCPDAAKASHVVVYGYIDPEEGLMLEVLGAGKQAPKYFYFKDPYEGERITIKASDVDEVEFMYFPDLQPRFRKKYDPRIAELKKYDADEDLEKTREFAFLDERRNHLYPDDVRVVFMKEGLKSEEVWVHLKAPGDHSLIGVLLNQPYQDYGVNKGDTIVFHVRETEDDSILCYKSFNEPGELTKEGMQDGSCLKEYIQNYEIAEDKTEAQERLIRVIRSSSVLVPCDVLLSDEASAIADRLEKEGKTPDSLVGEEADIFAEGAEFVPILLVADDGKKYMPAFTGEEEIGKHAEENARVHTPFIHALDMALSADDNISGIVINPYTDDYLLNRELFDSIRNAEPLFEDEDSYTQEAGYWQFTNREDLRLSVSVSKMDIFNYALYENNVPPIRGLRITNETGDTLEGLSIRITSTFAFFKKYEKPLPGIPSGKPIPLPDPHLVIDGRALAELTEAVNSEMLVELCKDGETVCGVRGQMKVLAYDQWQGGETYRDLLPAFVLPNHPVIPALMHDAADRLAKWNKPTLLEGYQANDPNRVRDLAAAAYAAIQ
nr:SseB family protein [Eubacterium sp.]